MHKELNWIKEKTEEEFTDMVRMYKGGKKPNMSSMNELETLSCIAANMAILDGYDALKHEYREDHEMRKAYGKKGQGAYSEYSNYDNEHPYYDRYNEEDRRRNREIGYDTEHGKYEKHKSPSI